MSSMDGPLFPVYPVFGLVVMCEASRLYAARPLQPHLRSCSGCCNMACPERLQLSQNQLIPPSCFAEYSTGRYMQSIQLAFATSSQALLQLLQHDLGLNHTLEALKHYFLLDKGDLLVSFLDTAEEELAKPASEVSVIRLQSLLDLGEPLLFSAFIAVADLLLSDCQHIVQ